jgi:hypothetical protein
MAITVTVNGTQHSVDLEPEMHTKAFDAAELAKL